MGTAHGALYAQNPSHALGADFTRNGMQLRAGGGAQWRMTLRGYGYGDYLEQVREATPVSQGNRVEYRRGPLVEWYVNGPAGLEQGFTLATAGKPLCPSSSRGGGECENLTFNDSVTIALGLGAT